MKQRGLWSHMDLDTNHNSAIYLVCNHEELKLTLVQIFHLCNGEYTAYLSYWEQLFIHSFY